MDAVLLVILICLLGGSYLLFNVRANKNKPIGKIVLNGDINKMSNYQFLKSDILAHFS